MPELPLLTVPELCDRWKITRQTLARWSRLGIAPPAICLGPRCTRYRADDVEAFEAAGTLEFGQQADRAMAIRDECREHGLSVARGAAGFVPDYLPVVVAPDVDAAHEPAKDTVRILVEDRSQADEGGDDE